VHRYTIYQGSFICHECKSLVSSMRFYEETKLMTWMCREKHLSQVSLMTRKKKADYERKV
jgi:hypothetical protein